MRVRRRRYVPFSLVLFVIAAGVYALQLNPMIGIVLMVFMAPFWSVLLINAGMIGVAIEGAIGRVPRWWLLLPLVFYGGYWISAAMEHLTLWSLSSKYDNANAQVTIEFDPARYALAFEGNNDGSWLVQHYALPVAYSVNNNFPEGYLSVRLLDREACDRVREDSALKAAFVRTYGIHDGEGIGNRQFVRGFCRLNMPERPKLPVVLAKRKEERIRRGRLPVTRITTTVTMPDGQEFELLGGISKPLPWMPLPVLGCALDSGAAEWECFTNFWRKGNTPIVSGNSRYRRDTMTLARALGLRAVAADERKAGDARLLETKMAAVQEATLARQLATVDAMIADPEARITDHRTEMVWNRPDILVSRADALMDGLERAVAAGRDHKYKAREAGRKLAGLVARLPDPTFRTHGQKILTLFETAGEEHWLWESSLLGRTGDLGVASVPLLVRPYGGEWWRIAGFCRVGAPGREAAETALLPMWNTSRNESRKTFMFVAMRRSGISPPPFEEDKYDLYGRLQNDWADISPQSPVSVCDFNQESKRRKNLKYRRHINAG